MITKPQLHVSMLNSLASCGIQFKRRYGHRFGIWPKEEVVPPSIALAVGSCVHAAVERNLQHMIDSDDRRPINRSDIPDIIQQEFSGFVERGLRLDEVELVDPEKTYQEAVAQATALALLHYDEVAPGLCPVAVERQFVIELTGEPVDLSGTIDVVERNCIRDTKTAKGAFPSAETPQMAMYCKAYWVASQNRETAEKWHIPYTPGGRYPEMVAIDVLKKLKTPTVQTVYAKPDDRWIQPLLHRVVQAIKIIEIGKTLPEVFTPARPGDWICTKKFCGYAETCEYWSGQ